MSQNNETILQQFADYFCALRYEDLPEDVVLKAKMLTLDLLGVAIAGVKMDFPRATIDYLASLRGVGQATLLGRKDKVPAIHAALGNGVSGHALDMDDGYRFGGMHSGVAVIPAARCASSVKVKFEPQPESVGSGIVMVGAAFVSAMVVSLSRVAVPESQSTV